MSREKCLNRLRLLLFSKVHLSHAGGGELLVAELARRLRYLGWRIDILTTSLGAAGDFTMADEGIVYRTITTIRGIGLPTPGGLRSLVAAARACDIIYFVDSAIYDWLMLFIRVLCRKRVLIGFHGSLLQDRPLHDLYVKVVKRLAVKYFDACHVLNAHDARILKAWGSRLVAPIRSGVDAEKFHPAVSKPRGPKFTVLFVGRLSREKGADVLLRAIRALNGQGLAPCLRFVLAGTGEEEREVQRLAKKEANVEHLGYVPHDRLPPLYSNAHLLVLPSRREALPLVLLEAHASGLPVVASNLPGSREVVIDGETGTLIPAGDGEALARGIHYWYSMWNAAPDKFEAAAAMARQHVVRTFSWKDFASALDRLMRHLLARESPRP